MVNNRRSNSFRLPQKIQLLGLLIFLLLTPFANLQAQDQADTPVERLVISGTSAESLPSIEVRLYGRDAQGNPLDLSQQSLDILHGGEPVGLINYEGAQQTGTLTLFLIDIPGGVQAQFPAIQDAINQYASPGNMMEGVDYTAVYQVGLADAKELLAPTNFFNSVRNAFAEPLIAETGATALYDSTAVLLDRAASLTPNPDMPVHIVLMTDGTDAVSTAATAEGVIQKAAELGIPVHTVLLDNADLGADLGQDYLTQLAAGSGGVALQMNNPADLALVWNRIGGFRDQARIRYEVSNLTGGTYPIDVALTEMPWITDSSEVNIPFNIPSVVIELAPESRTLTLANLAEPVRLRFQTAVSWLDGETREVAAAQLIINGDKAASYDITVANLDDFVADVSNLTYGNNTVEIAIVDSQGMQASSPTVILTVNEGRTDIPSELSGGNGFASSVGRFLGYLFILLLIAGGVFFLWQRGLFSKLGTVRLGGGERSRRRRGGPTMTVEDAPLPTAMPTTTKGYLEVLEAVTRTEPSVPLQGTIVRIGRSPAQCEIAFENDITVSRVHANLQLEGSDYRIFDENSTSGTFVNERQVPDYGIQLMDGDEIHLGAVHLRYHRA